jgi:D-serine deaminase-like pyridoxal phosphate-dependent protein
MAAVTRRQYKGAAAQTTIVNAIGSGDTSCTLAATTGWPSTASVPFFVVIDPGTASEEKCSATISGSVLTLTRAQDDTTAASHAAGATIYPVFSADEADEANKFTSTMTTRGDLLTMNSSVDPTRIALGAKGAILVTDGSDPSWLTVGTNDYVLTADSTQTKGVKWAQAISSGDTDQIVIAVQVFS